MSTPSDRPYRFAIQGGPFGDAAALADHARLVEELGYVELYTSDHVGSPDAEGRRGGRYVVDPFAPLLIAASATTSLRVGPLVLNNEFYNPALLARTAATVDALSDGRLVLGLGTGYSAAEHESIGQPIRPPGARVTRFGESLAVLRALLDNASVEHVGEHETVRFDDLGVYPQQARVPFLIGGHGARVVRLAAQFADIFQFTGLTHDADGTPGAGGFGIDEVVRRSDWLSEAAGERDAEIVRSALVQFVACGDDAPTLSDLAAQFELDEAVVAETPFVLSGSLEQVVDKIGRLRESLGITHFVVREPEVFAPVVDALT